MKTNFLKRKKINAVTLFFLVAVWGVFANVKTVPEKMEKEELKIAFQQGFKGVVLDEEGNPLAGASVVLKDTNIGIETNFDGAFVFPKPLTKGSVLVISYVGYQKKEYVVNEITSTAVVLRLDVYELVMVGAVSSNEVYQSKKKPTFVQRLQFWKKKE